MATRTASRRSSAGDKLRSRTRPRILSRASMNSLSSLACSGQLMVRVESKHIGHLLKTARSNVTPRRTKSKYYFSLYVRLKALCAVRPLERRPSFPSLNFLTCASEKCTFQKLYQGRSIMQTQGQPHRGSKTPKSTIPGGTSKPGWIPVKRLVAAHKLVERSEQMACRSKRSRPSQIRVKACATRGMLPRRRTARARCSAIEKRSEVIAPITAPVQIDPLAETTTRTVRQGFECRLRANSRFLGGGPA